MKNRRISLLLLSLVIMGWLAPASAKAGDLEFTFAGALTKVSGDSTTHGLSARIRYFFSKKSSTFFLQSNFPANNILFYDAMAGFSLRTQGTVFFELGAGYRVSPLWGSGFAFIAGVGANANDRWYVNFPIIYRVGFQLEATPYIGYRF